MLCTGTYYYFHCKMCNNYTFFIAYAVLLWKSMIFIVLSSLETVHDTVHANTVFFYCSIVS